jgi:hypothetical protein
MARWSRGNTLPGLTCHSDAGSQFTSIRYGERLAEIGAVPSIGTVGDSFDNALAETVNGYYKSELIYGPARTGPWKTAEDVELATLGWGPLTQHQPAARLSQRHTASRVRSRVLRYGTDRPTPGRNPIARASITTPSQPGRFNYVVDRVYLDHLLRTELAGRRLVCKLHLDGLDGH